jgi:hypothetical protein
MRMRCVKSSVESRRKLRGKRRTMGLLKVGAPYDRRDTPSSHPATWHGICRPQQNFRHIHCTVIPPLAQFIQSVPDIDRLIAFTYQSENIAYGYASVALSVVVSVLYADMTIAADNQDYTRYAAIKMEFTSYMTSKAGICL